jgi:hypothetical protein
LNIELEVGDFINEISLEQLAQMAMYNGKKFCFFANINERKILVLYQYINAVSEWVSGKCMTNIKIVEIGYCYVEDYKKFILYNPHGDKEGAHYDNKSNDLTQHDSYIVQVLNFPDLLLAKALKEIKEKIKGE